MNNCDLRVDKKYPEGTGPDDTLVQCTRKRAAIIPTPDYGRIGMCDPCHREYVKRVNDYRTARQARAKIAKGKKRPPLPLPWIKLIRGMPTVPEFPTE